MFSKYSFWCWLLLCLTVTRTQSQPTSTDPDQSLSGNNNGIIATSAGNIYDEYEDGDGELDDVIETKKVPEKPGKRTLSFVKELKNVTKEAGDFLKLKCDVTGSIPATSIQVR